MNRFEEIEAWQKARKLAGRVYKTTNAGEFKRDFGLRDQVRRAAVSVMANIAEGFGRKTHKDFAKFLYTSKASALDLEYLTKKDFDEIHDGYNHVQGMLVNLIKHLETS